IICMQTSYSHWEYTFTANGDMNIDVVIAEFLYPITTNTAGGTANSSSCSTIFNYKVKFYKNNNLHTTVNKEIEADFFTVENIQPNNALTLSNGDTFKMLIEGLPSSSSCDLFELRKLRVLGCCDPGTNTPVPPDWMFDCEEGKTVGIYGKGCESSSGTTVNVPSSSNVYQAAVEVVYKGSSYYPGTSVTVNVDGTNYILNEVDISGTSSSVYAYRGLVTGQVTNVTHVGNCPKKGSQNGMQSLVVYAFRNITTPETSAGTFVEKSGYCDVQTINIPIPTDNAPRDIMLSIPVSEMTDDGRHMLITASAGGASGSAYITGPGAGNECCFNLVEFTIPNVPGSANNIAIQVDTRPSADQNSTQNCGQSWVIAGSVRTDIECIDCEIISFTCPANKTISCDESIDPSNTGEPTVNATCATVLTYEDEYDGGTCPQTITRTWTVTAEALIEESCHPVTLAHWNFAGSNGQNNCELYGGDPLQAGIPATSTNSSTCNYFDVSKVTKDGKSSCVQGAFGSPKSAICVGSQDGTGFVNNDSDATEFTITFGASDAGSVTQFCFHERAVNSNENFGTNYPPQNYGIRVTKNGSQVFKQTGLNTTNSWSQVCFDFTSDSDFDYVGATVYKFELLGYNPTSQNPDPDKNIWELDEFNVYGCCGSSSTPVTVTETCTQMITLTDTEFPVITNVPADLTVNCVNDIPDVQNDVNASDNCSFETDFTETTSGSEPCNYVLTRTWTATDACNNSVSESQTISIINDIVTTASAPNNPEL
ncbi:MAG: hypothetical protein KJN84_10575, partial [Bacteroidia bacterium]|nr:hypothetical protein [Bacteroidia bacterium]